jgi:hypothetical protein
MVTGLISMQEIIQLHGALLDMPFQSFGIAHCAPKLEPPIVPWMAAMA